jgi:protein deglycase
MTTVLVILPEGFEEIEAVTPIDLLRRAGFEVTIAALADGIHVTGRSGLTLHATTSLSSVPEDQAFDLLLLPGGPGVRRLRDDPRVRRRVVAQTQRDGWLAAICAAPTVLKDAGVLEGRNFTAHPSVADELPTVRIGERLVIDGKLITSRGAGTALEFGLQLVEALAGPAKAREIATAIAT